MVVASEKANGHNSVVCKAIHLGFARNWCQNVSSGTRKSPKRGQNFALRPMGKVNNCSLFRSQAANNDSFLSVNSAQVQYRFNSNSPNQLSLILQSVISGHYRSKQSSIIVRSNPSNHYRSFQDQAIVHLVTIPIIPIDRSNHSNRSYRLIVQINQILDFLMPYLFIYGNNRATNGILQCFTFGESRLWVNGYPRKMENLKTIISFKIYSQFTFYRPPYRYD